MFTTSGKFTVEVFKERIDLSYPNWDYEIIQFDGCKAPMVKLKKDYCKANNIELLEIKYTELKNIKQILSSKFNDQSKDVGLK